MILRLPIGVPAGTGTAAANHCWAAPIEATDDEDVSCYRPAVTTALLCAFHHARIVGSVGVRA